MQIYLTLSQTYRSIYLYVFFHSRCHLSPTTVGHLSLLTLHLHSYPLVIRCRWLSPKTILYGLEITSSKLIYHICLRITPQMMNPKPNYCTLFYMVCGQLGVFGFDSWAWKSVLPYIINVGKVFNCLPPSKTESIQINYQQKF